MSYSFKGMKEAVYNFQTSKVYKSPRSTWRQHPAPTNPTDPDVKAGGGGEREGFSQIQLSMERKKEKKKKERRREREAEQRYFHWHGSRAAISFFHHTTNMSLLFWHLLTLTSKSSSLLKNYLSLGDELDHCTSSNFYYMRVKSTDATQTAALSFLSPWKWVYIN